MKKILIGAILLNIFCILIPFAITKQFHNDKTISQAVGENNLESIELVYIDDNANEVKINFEDYIIGVVAAEMPALFHHEALKAQSIVSRTYALQKINLEKINSEKNYIENISQAFLTIEEMKKLWGDDFVNYYNRISLAVSSTNGEVIFYGGEPIEAVFHATSGGYTENSENIWNVSLPYLKSVDSSFDEEVADFIHRHEFTDNELKQILKSNNSEINFSKYSFINEFEISESSENGYVQKLKIANITYTGAEIRNILNLKSTNFTTEDGNGKIIFVTKGYGHGVGMSQTGANYLSQTGYDYKKIISYYYHDIEIGRYGKI